MIDDSDGAVALPQDGATIADGLVREFGDEENVAAGLRLAEKLGGIYWLIGKAEDGYGAELERLLSHSMTGVRRALPRGGTMDAPLVITSRIDPMEIDKESHNLDVCARYPRELYEKALAFTHPKEIEKSIDDMGDEGD